MTKDQKHERAVLRAEAAAGRALRAQEGKAPVLTETITWIPVERELPDAEITVLGWRKEWIETCDVFLDGDCWREAASAASFDGDTLESMPPTHWAHKPGGPNL
jgi:hypothetical protein